MISGGELGVREDVFKAIMHVKGICSNIGVFTNGTFIDKYLEDILKNVVGKHKVSSIDWK